MTVRAMKAGAVEFLTKPFDDQVLPMRSMRPSSAIAQGAATRRASRR